ncbi:MAG: VWA domain-containing protein [Rubripirellula sp.]|nr:VWA domain-containing protein [Rubripirellula sp.]
MFSVFGLAMIACVACSPPSSTSEPSVQPETQPVLALDDPAEITNEQASEDEQASEVELLAAGTGEETPEVDRATTTTNSVVGEDSPAASAMSTIFSPARAPKRKTMGLLQRSFLDMADQGDQELEIAIVVDGTDSMATELAGVRRSIHQMLADLQRYRNNEVRVALVVYRDAGSPSGEVSILLDKFTTDEDAIENAVQKLQPESGAPFFHELTDEGVHRSIKDLPWTDDNQVTKWIILFGDAPPYSPSYADDANPKARRRYADSILVSMAKRKNIRINCVLCTSGGNVSESYKQSIDQTRAFMNAMAAGTDGLMLDLSYEAIRTAIIDAANQPEVGLAKMEPITALDMASVRRDQKDTTSNTRTVSLAVVPHMPLAQITFAANHPAVRVSTAIRTKLASIPGVRVASPRDIKEQLRRLRAEGISPDQAMRGLAGRLGVDFVVWGQLVPEEATYQTAAYRRDDGKQILPISLADHPHDTAFALVQASAKSRPDDQALAYLIKNMESIQSALKTPLSASTSTNDNLLTAMEALEQALAFESGSAESVDLLETADQSSKDARTAEPSNGIAHWLNANVAYNQASRLYEIGNNEAAKQKMNEMRASLSEALKHRQAIASKSLVTEIEADYYLLVARDAAKAVERYTAMTALDQPRQSQLRGHWMLSGIRAGDWGTAEQSVVDPAESRRHLIEIMANWPASPETQLLKQWMRWDETTEQTQFNYLPTVNLGLTGTAS